MGKKGSGGSPKPSKANDHTILELNYADKGDGFDDPKQPHLEACIKNYLDTIKSDILVSIDTMIAKKLNPLMESIEFCTNKITDFERILSEFSKVRKQMDTIIKENLELKKQILNLRDEANDLQQYSRMNNLEISNVPETTNENLISMMSSIGEALDCPIQSVDLDMIHRVQAGANTIDKNRPKNIVVRFVSRLKRNELLTAIKSKKKLTTSELGMKTNNQNIYINEHLCPANKHLFLSARFAAKQLAYKYIWHRNGRTFVRKSDSQSSPVVAIKGEADLAKII